MRPVFLAALLAFCAGCAPRIEEIARESNYLTYEHPFTDAAAETALRNADRECAKKKQTAVRTTSACTLTRCTAHFQCVDPSEAAQYRPQGAGK